MKASRSITRTLVLIIGLAASMLGGQSINPGDHNLKIGIVDGGKIGGTLGELWARAGHRVFLSSRHPERLRNLVQSIGRTYDLRSEAHRSSARVAVPLAADDESALNIALPLVEDAGFEPVIVGL